MKRNILIWLLCCVAGLMQLSAKTVTDSINVAKINRSKPGAAISEYLDRIQQNPDRLRQNLKDQQERQAKAYQDITIEAFVNPVPVKAKTDFGSQSIDYSLTHGGFIPSDLLYDQGLLDRRRAEIKKKNATKGVLIIFSIAVVGFGIFCIVKSRKKFSEIDTNEKS